MHEARTHTYGMVHRKHYDNSVCRLTLFIVIARLSVNIGLRERRTVNR